MLSLDFLDDVRRMNKRQLYYQVLNFGMIVSSALMIWKGLMVITGSESPIVVVLSGSMEPAFHRGDLLFLTNRVEDPIRVGEIVVFRIEGREIPIVHRVLKIHEKQDGHIKFLTKGDNNAVDDRGLYKQGQHWLEKKDVVGRARGFVPYIGIVTILMNDYPKFKPTDPHRAGVDAHVDGYAITLSGPHLFSVDDTLPSVHLDRLANLLTFVVSLDNLNFIFLSNGHYTSVSAFGEWKTSCSCKRELVH
uniref:Signal peptidase complex catalytic subunit SEC11 n=1 Tax=Mus spicilegus TaxID=10103 RepID=A0A8C6MPW4_MUSSI